MPQLTCLTPQMLRGLVEAMQQFQANGMLKAAADVAHLLGQCSLCSLPPSPPPCHVCPLNFPPPSCTPSRRRRRRRRRRSTSPGSTTCSSSLSTEVDSLLTCIMELPVTSVVEAELGVEELTWDDTDVCIAKDESKEMQKEEVETLSRAAMVKLPQSRTVAAIVTSLLDEMLSSVVVRAPSIAKSAIRVEEKDKVEASKMQDQWVDSLVTAIDVLEAKYTPHPLPYEDPPGEIHSADVRPPQVDFTALGFNSRRLPTPELRPIHGCSPSPDLSQSESFPFGALPGLLTNGGVIQVPQQLFGFEYVPGTSGKNTTWMMCAT